MDLIDKFSLRPVKLKMELKKVCPESGQAMLQSRSLIRPLIAGRAPSQRLADRCLRWLLLQKRQEQSDEGLENLAQQLYDLAQDPRARIDFGRWLAADGRQWIEQGYRTLGVAVEVSALIGLPETADAIVDILERYHSDSQTVAVAAQRIRLISFDNDMLRQRAFTALKRWIERWEQQPATREIAAIALPSIAYVGGGDALAWLLERIDSGPSDICRAACIGILDWATGAIKSPQTPATLLLHQAAEAIIARIVDETKRHPRGKPNPIPELAWALGACATDENIARIGMILAAIFLNPQGLDSAGALRGGRLLVQTKGAYAFSIFEQAFQQAPEAGKRYLDFLKNG